MNGTNCIEIKRLTKRYYRAEVDTLKGIDLNIQTGDRFGILGPNGAGKTTLISILCGIIEASTGHCTFYQKNQSLSPKELPTFIGFVPQDFALYEALTPYQNLAYFGALHNLSKQVIKERAEELLKILGLEHVANKKVSTFSGGMKRRVNLAIGIIHNPTILFLDEPTVGVDVQSKMAIMRFLEAYNKKGTTIVYTSHHLDEAQEFCNQIALIDEGRIILKGATDTLLKENKLTDLKALFIKFTGEAYRD